MKHGTMNAYERYGCRCEDCLAANREKARRYRRARGVPVRTAPTHGSLPMYRQGCRCPACTEANRDASRRQRIRQGANPRWNKTAMDRFLAKVAKTDTCWLWVGAVIDNGYGRFGKLYAHRWVYEQSVGPIPEGLTIDHLCRVRNCVNPEHLEAVTQGENIRRAWAAKREAS